MGNNIYSLSHWHSNRSKIMTGHLQLFKRLAGRPTPHHLIVLGFKKQNKTIIPPQHIILCPTTFKALDWEKEKSVFNFWFCYQYRMSSWANHLRLRAHTHHITMHQVSHTSTSVCTHLAHHKCKVMSLNSVWNKFTLNCFTLHLLWINST